MAYPNPFDLRHQRPGSGGDLVKRFLATFGSRKTRRNYRTDLRQFFGEEEVTRPVASQVRKKDIVGFFRERTDSFKRTTVERKVEASRSFFRWLADQNVIEELPIREDLDTGDLVDRIFEEALETTKEKRADEKSADAENASRDEDGAGGRGQDDATRSIREPIPMEPEPGSVVGSGDEAASGDGESSSPRGRPTQDAGDEEPSGPGQTSLRPARRQPPKIVRLGNLRRPVPRTLILLPPATDRPRKTHHRNPPPKRSPAETGRPRRPQHVRSRPVRIQVVKIHLLFPTGRFRPVTQKRLICAAESACRSLNCRTLSAGRFRQWKTQMA